MPHNTSEQEYSPAQSASQPSSKFRKQSQHSIYAKSALMNTIPTLRLDETKDAHASEPHEQTPRSSVTSGATTSTASQPQAELKPIPYVQARHLSKDGVGHALSDTPVPTAPSSPKLGASRQNSSVSTPRIRPTTLDIPGLTKSKVSPDGRISQRDVGAKLVIVMVGLPARGKSYITKKMARYLNWLQHDTRIFNVGERRRVAAGGGQQLHRADSQAKGRPGDVVNKQSISTGVPNGIIPQREQLDPPQIAAKILINGVDPVGSEPANSSLNAGQGQSNSTNGDRNAQDASADDHSHLQTQVPELTKASTPEQLPDTEAMEQSADFFDPNNKKGALIREQVAMETLDELLDYILEQGGSVGILDATNSTLERRKLIMRRVRERAGQELNVVFVESVCMDEALLEANMRLKLSGPDYKDKDPVASLADFKKRVAIYEKAYVPLGEYEEKNNMAYIQMIDVGRKVISHQLKGFLSAQTAYYLLNFNLAPRQIWITRHGESMDNQNGKIGGDSDLSGNGRRYAKALARFMEHERKVWEVRQQDKARHTHFPPHPGDHTPPNPHYSTAEGEGEEGGPPMKSFCVWTSMLKRSIQTGEYFDEEEFDVKQMRMLDELNAGVMEGMTYEEIRSKYGDEYELRKNDKLQYRYPGPGGEGYLDVINRLRPLIIELERMTDHVLLITHRSVARVLLAYFKGLRRDEVADLDCPLGMLYMLEPKPYGVEFKAYRYNAEKEWFDYLPDYQLRRAEPHH